MTPDYDYRVQTSNNCNNFVVFPILCWYYVKNIIKKLEMHLLLVMILFKMNLGMPKLLCPKLVKRCRKQPVSTPDVWNFAKKFMSSSCVSLLGVDFFIVFLQIWYFDLLSSVYYSNIVWICIFCLSSTMENVLQSYSPCNSYLMLDEV